LLLILLICVVAGFGIRKQFAMLRHAQATGFAELTRVNQENRALLNRLQATQTAQQTRIDTLETKLAEVLSQTSALSADAAGRRDDRALADAVQAITLASQQLQFAGNVELARLALQNAEARLAEAGQVRFASLRNLLIRDIARLQALPGADIPGIAARIESVVVAVDELPPLFARRPVNDANPPTAAKTGNAPAATSAASAFMTKAYWQSLWADTAAELHRLIRLERIDSHEPALMSPTQEVFLRENLKLHLLGARLALLQRDGKTFHEEMRQTQILLERYFDPRAKSVSTALTTIKTLAATDIGGSLPSLDETLAAANALASVRRRQ
jgi:uncharacterized protein HemX